MEERLYSVTMTEEELRLFSEFLEQREYTGPTKMANKALKNQQFMDRNRLGRPALTAAGTKEYVPRTTSAPNTWTPQQRSQNMGISMARKAERNVSAPNGFSYHAGDSKRNVDTLNRKITAGVKSSPVNSQNPSQNLTNFKGNSRLQNRGVMGTVKDIASFGKDYNNPSAIGKNIKLKGLK